MGVKTGYFRKDTLMKILHEIGFGRVPPFGQGHGHRLQQAYLGPTAKQKSIRIPSRMQFGENNIMEDELPCLLISAPDNCLPRCWARSEENDDQNKDCLLYTSDAADEE